MIIGIIVVIIALATFAGILKIPEIPSNTSTNFENPDNFGGPTNEILSLNKNEYKLGEHIFVYVAGIKETDKGNIIFVTPEQIILKDFPIDGSSKTAFNTYFTPDTSVFMNICTPDELVGTWTVYFKDLPYDPIEFEIINDYIPREEENVKVEC